MCGYPSHTAKGSCLELDLLLGENRKRGRNNQAEQRWATF